ncbi:WXG100 family type VII secretion target [Mycolicibacterium sp. GF69]|uniref:WXG100 family type VII secretion target n=1 Tax=Mycolicibacterium sp. GF69 TaxID=2267251 RepID=UPI000DCE5FF7|nr:WXG100 family type VII secretion target [Mycolicibacterium sp. GF69]RAV08228.1 WXG100 family type VII secretion target [Mycolicibacterium sp. GF69]
MSDEKIYNFAAIDAGAEEIQSAVAQTETLLHEGKSSLTTLATVWGGEGSEAYQAVQMRWDSTSTELNAALKNLAIAVAEAGGTGGVMANAERCISGSFGG